MLEYRYFCKFINICIYYKLTLTIWGCKHKSPKSWVEQHDVLRQNNYEGINNYDLLARSEISCIIEKTSNAIPAITDNKTTFSFWPINIAVSKSVDDTTPISK